MLLLTTSRRQVHVHAKHSCHIVGCPSMYWACLWRRHTPPQRHPTPAQQYSLISQLQTLKPNSRAQLTTRHDTKWCVTDTQTDRQTDRPGQPAANSSRQCKARNRAPTGRLGNNTDTRVSGSRDCLHIIHQQNVQAEQLSCLHYHQQTTTTTSTAPRHASLLAALSRKHRQQHHMAGKVSRVDTLHPSFSWQQRPLHTTYA